MLICKMQIDWKGTDVGMNPWAKCQRGKNPMNYQPKGVAYHLTSVGIRLQLTFRHTFTGGPHIHVMAAVREGVWLP